MADDVRAGRTLAPRVEAFRVWLATHYHQLEFERSWIEGILLISGARAVTTSDVDSAIAFAEEARNPPEVIAELRKLGVALIEFEAGRRDTEAPVAATAKPRADTAKPRAVTQPVAITERVRKRDQAGEPQTPGRARDRAATAEPRDRAAGPLQPRDLFASTSGPLEPRDLFASSSEPLDGASIPPSPREPATSAPDPVDSIPDPPVAEPRAAIGVSVRLHRPPTAARGETDADPGGPDTGVASAAAPARQGAVAAVIRRQWRALTAAVAVAAVGAIGYSALSGDDAPAKPAAAPTRAAPRPAARTGLPEGWQLTGPATSDKLTAFSGGSRDDPDHGLFVGRLALTGDNARLKGLDGPRLAAATEHIERAVARQIARDGGSYRSTGCQVTKLGGHPVGLCGGTASGRGEPRAVRTYLRIGAADARVALSLAREKVATAATDADRIVAELR